MSTNNANNSGAVDKKPKTTSGDPPKVERVDAPSGNTNKKADVHFDSTEIGKNKTEYFVNVEGAEERKRAYIEQRKKEIEQAKKDAERKKIKAEEKAKADAKAAQKRVTDERRALAKKKASEKRKAKKEKIVNIFFAGKRKYITAATIVIIILAAIIVPPVIRKKIEQEEIANNNKEYFTTLQKQGIDSYNLREKADNIIAEKGYSALGEAKQLFIDALNSASDDDKPNFAIAYSSFLYEYNKDAKEAVGVLEDYAEHVDENNRQRGIYYSLMRDYYIELGDEEKVKQYEIQESEDEQNGFLLLEDGTACKLPSNTAISTFRELSLEEKKKLCVD